jgi:hypothetical protein
MPRVIMSVDGTVLTIFRSNPTANVREKSKATNARSIPVFINLAELEVAHMTFHLIQHVLNTCKCTDVGYCRSIHPLKSSDLVDVISRRLIIASHRKRLHK